MNFAKLFVVSALLATSVSAYAAAPDSIPARTIKLSGVTATTVIKVNGNTVTLNPGDAMPVLDPNATIEVVSGSINVESGGVTVTAKAGDSFAFATPATGGGVSVVVKAGSVDIKGTDGKTQSVAAGKTATVVDTTTAPPAEAPGADPIVITVITVVTNPVQNNDTDTCTNTVSPSAPCP